MKYTERKNSSQSLSVSLFFNAKKNCCCKLKIVGSVGWQLIAIFCFKTAMTKAIATATIVATHNT